MGAPGRAAQSLSFHLIIHDISPSPALSGRHPLPCHFPPWEPSEAEGKRHSWGIPEWLAEQLPRGRQLVGGERAEAWELHLLRLALRLTPSPSAPGLLPIPALPMPHLPEFPTSWHASEGSFSPSESQISGSSKKKKKLSRIFKLNTTQESYDINQPLASVTFVSFGIFLKLPGRSAEITEVSGSHTHFTDVKAESQAKRERASQTGRWASPGAHAHSVCRVEALASESQNWADAGHSPILT